MHRRFFGQWRHWNNHALRSTPGSCILGFPLAATGEAFACLAETSESHRIELEFTVKNGLLPASFGDVFHTRFSHSGTSDPGCGTDCIA